MAGAPPGRGVRGAVPTALSQKQGRNQLFISGGQFSWNFVPWRHHAYSTVVQLFRKRSHNNIIFLPPDTKSIVQTHTFCTTLVNKNRQNRPFYNSVGDWITGVKRNFWLHAICACTDQHATYKIPWENWWLRVWCLGKCVRLGFMLQLEKEK